MIDSRLGLYFGLLVFFIKKLSSSSSSSNKVFFFDSLKGLVGAMIGFTSGSKTGFTDYLVFGFLFKNPSSSSSSENNPRFAVFVGRGLLMLVGLRSTFFFGLSCITKAH